MIKNNRQIFFGLVAMLAAAAVIAAGTDLGQTTKQETNWTAIAIFIGFVAVTLLITKWAAARTKTAADFYTAGSGISSTSSPAYLSIASRFIGFASVSDSLAILRQARRRVPRVEGGERGFEGGGRGGGRGGG